MVNEKYLLDMVKKATTLEQVFSSIAELEFMQPSNRLTAVIAKKLNEVKQESDIKVALLSNFTVDMLMPHVAASLATIGFTSEFYVAPYNQYYQEVLDPASGLLEYKPHIIVLTLSMRELSPDIFFRYAELSSIQRQEKLEAVLDNILDWLKTASQNLTANILVTNFIPVSQTRLGIADSREGESETEFYHRLNKNIREILKNFKQAYLLDLSKLSQIVGWKNTYDPKLYFLAKLMWSDEFLYYISKEITNYTYAIKGKTKKCLVLDLDNTLWGGILGEDGIQGLKIGQGDPVGEAYYEFQHKLRSLKQRGIVLAICSKNNFDDVAEAFQARKDFPLSMNDFSAIRINWNMKHQNIAEIANELNIGLDSLVFVDDNPVEVNMVRKMLPEVIALLLPEAHEKIPNYLDSFPYFEKLFVIDTDRNKTQQYIQNKERSSLKNQATNLNEYLISLGTKVTLRNVKVEDIERVHQLFSKTNQFNLTTIRYQLSDIEMFIADMSYDLYCFSVEDKFGDLGTVGIVLIHRLNGIAEIDSFTMSCRAMGRGIENSIVNWLKDYYFTVQNFAQITGAYIPTKKNIPIKNFLPEQGFKQEYKENDKVCYSLNATESQSIQCGWIELILEV